MPARRKRKLRKVAVLLPASLCVALLLFELVFFALRAFAPMGIGWR